MWIILKYYEFFYYKIDLCLIFLKWVQIDIEIDIKKIYRLNVKIDCGWMIKKI